MAAPLDLWNPAKRRKKALRLSSKYHGRSVLCLQNRALLLNHILLASYSRRRSYYSQSEDENGPSRSRLECLKTLGLDRHTNCASIPNVLSYVTSEYLFSIRSILQECVMYCAILLQPIYMTPHRILVLCSRSFKFVGPWTMKTSINDYCFALSRMVTQLERNF